MRVEHANAAMNIPAAQRNRTIDSDQQPTPFQHATRVDRRRVRHRLAGLLFPAGAIGDVALAFQDNSLLLARQAFADAIHLGFRISAVIVLVVTAMIVKRYDGELELPRAN